MENLLNKRPHLTHFLKKDHQDQRSVDHQGHRDVRDLSYGVGKNVLFPQFLHSNITLSNQILIFVLNQYFHFTLQSTAFGLFTRITFTD